MTTTTTEPTTRTIDVPGADLTWDIRPNDTSTETPLLVICSPMGASGFGTLAGHFADRTVLTYDPRGVERSPKDDPRTESSPEQHADDLHAVIAAAGVGPVDVFASSGGAVNALALVARHPDDVRTLVAHEPPLAAILPDREALLAATEDIGANYQQSGFGPAMAKFIGLISRRGQISASDATQPAPDPAMFGMPSADDGSRGDPLLEQNIITCTHFEPDFDALRAAPTRIVPAAGSESEGEMANRGAHAAAERLGTAVAVFPGGHNGFLGGEYGQTGQPDEFAATLRRVLAAEA